MKKAIATAVSVLLFVLLLIPGLFPERGDCRLAADRPRENAPHVQDRVRLLARQRPAGHRYIHQVSIEIDFHYVHCRIHGADAAWRGQRVLDLRAGRDLRRPAAARRVHAVRPVDHLLISSRGIRRWRYG